MTFPHDSFCRGVLSDVPTFLELLHYLTTRDEELKDIFKLLDERSFKRMPSDYSNTEKTGYADLAFSAEVLQEFLTDKAMPVQICVGFLVEHKSARDDGVMDQLRRYHYYLMENQLKANAEKGIPSIAIILYNGKDDWDPLKKLQAYPKELQRYLLPFKCMLLNVKEISDETLCGFGARLSAFICSMKYIRNPESSRENFKNILDRVRTELPETEALDLLHQMDVYLGGWLENNFTEVFKMDFVRPNYKTVGDQIFEEGEKHQAEETARRMLAKNRPMNEITEFTGLTEEQVHALQS